MGQDQLGAVADERLIELAIDVKVQLEKGVGTRPILWLLSRARRRAAEAFVRFADVDPNDAKAIILLQNDVVLYDNLIADVKQLLSLGRDAHAEIRERDRAEIEEITGSSEEFGSETPNEADDT